MTTVVLHVGTGKTTVHSLSNDNVQLMETYALQCEKRDFMEGFFCHGLELTSTSGCRMCFLF